MMNLIRSFSNAANQGEVDYQNVIRPAMFALGGNGAMQYMQLMNRSLGLDNVESRANARTNVSNWLRVIGREVGMEMRPAGKGYGTPTEMTPHITRMQLAALADDAEGFNKAWREAVAQAQENPEKYEDPEKYVADAYQSRHPLRSIYRVAPTEEEYHRKILPALPEDGRQDVEDAINLYNRYGAMLGVNPYEGKEERAKKSTSRMDRKLEGGLDRRLDRLGEIRERALLGL